MPKVLSKIYQEDKERFQLQAEDEALMIREFDKRKTDSHYYMLMQKRRKR